jgi:hypothetical protein
MARCQFFNIRFFDSNWLVIREMTPGGVSEKTDDYSKRGEATMPKRGMLTGIPRVEAGYVPETAQESVRVRQ